MKANKLQEENNSYENNFDNTLNDRDITFDHRDFFTKVDNKIEQSRSKPKLNGKEVQKEGRYYFLILNIYRRNAI